MGINSFEAAEILRDYLAEEPIIIREENGEEKITYSTEAMAAVFILETLYKNNLEYHKIIDKVIPLGNPLVDPLKIINKAYDSKEDLVNLHNIVVSGLRKKANTAHKKLPN